MFPSTMMYQLFSPTGGGYVFALGVSIDARRILSFLVPLCIQVSCPNADSIVE